MPNILTLPELGTANSLAEVYVVYNNTDYRMTLKTLLSLVTATSLGLDKVNNTSDNEKPVSSATALELAKKANIDDVVSKATFDALVKTIGTYVSQETLDTAIKGVTDQLSGFVTSAQVQSVVNDALATITATVDALTQNVATNTQAIAQLTEQTKGMVTETTLTQAINAAKQELIQQLNAALDPFNVTIGQLNTHLTALDQSIAALQQALDAKADKVHSHAPGDITGLSDYVTDLVGTATGTVTVGSTEW